MIDYSDVRICLGTTPTNTLRGWNVGVEGKVLDHFTLVKLSDRAAPGSEERRDSMHNSAGIRSAIRRGPLARTPIAA